MSSDHFPPWTERQGKSGFAWSSLGAPTPGDAFRSGQARQSSQPTPPSGATVRRHQESTAAVAIGRCRLPDKSRREPTGESDGVNAWRSSTRAPASERGLMRTSDDQL
jgi:hypothetical protein